MPDSRAVMNLSQRVASAHAAVEQALRRAGYDPATLDALPEPGDCGCGLALAIREWRAANLALDAARERVAGWSGR
jgi:hypothetical protein